MSPCDTPTPSQVQADKADLSTDIRLAAMNLLARREHSRLELRQKLCRRFDNDLLIEEQLQRLTEENLQSDQRFAESLVRQRASRGVGPLRIERDAMARGLESGDIQRAIAEAELNWSEIARGVLQKKFGSQQARDLKDRARRTRFMQYRGFVAEQFVEFL